MIEYVRFSRNRKLHGFIGICLDILDYALVTLFIIILLCIYVFHFAAVQGDSMLPKFEDGDTIILRKTDQCESGQICAVYVNGYNATLKKVIITDQPAQIILQPLNADYDPMVYDYDPANPDYVKICGVVVEIRRSVNL